MSNAMKILEGFFDSQRIRLSSEGFRYSSIPPQLVRRTIDLLNRLDDDCASIWLQWIPNLVEDPQNNISSLAANQVNETHRTSIPRMSYFCSINSQDPREGNPSKEVEGFVSLVYALLHQFLADIYSFPPEDAPGQSRLGAVEQRISGLDGTARTLHEALSAFDGAAHLLRMYNICIIDGLHLLEGPDTHDQLCELVRILRKTIWKLTFTTSGGSSVLSKEMDPEDCVKVDEE
ncbi:uncharacterized protein NECHADRAFT_78453 [Fusarium vanettenii 77-13-4]|uniref:Uncharacterized protein n=1 Tax=Fusarium vanettenii (strain ATCC MYA-4622 / CBS 123669 / FGSC 9596 / NRRL 45880 / 77-13-4) TaxID=660122 RepID=C7ZFR3_FUSV7|nr:uncharacterized protein NECHADRAFT_78453 [Fusarium vanettenii 77-13-4]EEU37217.1 hypothetical protein NECHADRAFT_78453 [Fusarium vanettenii 77-13-4]